MKKLLYLVLFIAGVVLVFLLNRGSSNRIEVTNTGTNIIEVNTDNNENKVLLGQNGTRYLDLDSTIQIGNATVKVGERVEIKNTGSDVIQITYNDKEDSEKNILLGQNGTGYINKSTPFKIGNAMIQVGDVQ